MHRSLNHRLIIPTALTAVFLVAAAGVGLADWPSFHGDARNSGFTANDAPFDSLLAWTYEAGDSIFYSSPVVDDGGNIYMGTLGEELIALDFTGELKWAYQGQGNFRHSTPAVAADGTIYIGGSDGVLHAVDPDGGVVWTLPLLSPLKTSPNIADDGTIYIGAENGIFYAVHPNGTVYWSFPTGGALRSSPAIAPDGTILFGSEDHKLYAVNPDGSERWSAVTGDIIKFCSPAVSETGDVYFGSYDGFIYAVNVDQTFLWAYDTGHVVRSSPAIGPNGRIFVGAGTDLIALTPDGQLEWHYNTDSEIYSSPVYFGDDDVICVGSDDGTVYAVHADGGLDWKFTVGSPVRTVTAPGLFGNVYAADLSGTVWAFGATPPTSAPGGWQEAVPGILPTRNPAAGSVTFLAQNEAASRAGLSLYDVGGRKILSLPGDGAASRTWNGLDAAGRRVPAGTYFYRLDGAERSGRVTLLR